MSSACSARHWYTCDAPSEIECDDGLGKAIKVNKMRDMINVRKFICAQRCEVSDTVTEVCSAGKSALDRLPNAESSPIIIIFTY